MKAGWERHILCHCIYRSPWRRSGKQLSRISPGKPACASKVSEAQKACRTGLLVLVRLAKEKQGEVKESTVLSWCFGGQEQGQHSGRGSQPFLPLWESMVWDYSGESEAEGLMRLFHGPSEIHIHVNKPWHERRSYCQCCKLFETGTIILSDVYTSLQQPGQ